MICSFILKYNLLFITKKMIMYQRACFIFQHAYSSSLLVGTVKYIVSQNFITVSTITGKIQMLQNVHLQ